MVRPLSPLIFKLGHYPVKTPLDKLSGECYSEHTTGGSRPRINGSFQTGVRFGGSFFDIVIGSCR